MIELSNIGIREIREDGTIIATATFIVKSPVPATYIIEVAASTIEEASDKIVDYIRGHCDEKESNLINVKTAILGILSESTKRLHLRGKLTGGKIIGQCFMDEDYLKTNIETYIHNLNEGNNQNLRGKNIIIFVNEMSDYDEVVLARGWLVAAAPQRQGDWHHKIVMLKNVFDFKLLDILAHNIAKSSSEIIAQNWADDLQVDDEQQDDF